MNKLVEDRALLKDLDPSEGMGWLLDTLPAIGSCHPRNKLKAESQEEKEGREWGKSLFQH